MRQISISLKSSKTLKLLNKNKLNLMSKFIKNIMIFCQVHHDRIINKINIISNPNSYLRLRDLEEINIISSFIYEIGKIYY